MIQQIKSCFFIFLVFLLSAKVVNAQNPSFDNAGRTTFILDIARYVSWKNTNKMDIYRIGILDRDSVFYESFSEICQNKTIQEKPISVKYFDKIVDVEGVDIVFLNRNTGFDIDLVYQQVAGKQVLLLSENYPFHKSMINFIVVGGEKRFEINQARMDAEGFKVPVTFAALAVKSELDWHKIYTETEKELYEQKEKVTELNISIAKQKEEIEKQKTVLSELLNEIGLQKNRLLTYVDEIQSLETEMNTQKLASAKLMADIQNKQKTLEIQKNLLNKMTKEVEDKEQENIKQEKILAKQTTSIKAQE